MIFNFTKLEKCLYRERTFFELILFFVLFNLWFFLMKMGFIEHGICNDFNLFNSLRVGFWTANRPNRVEYFIFYF